MALISDLSSLYLSITLWSDRSDLPPPVMFDFISFAGRRASQELRVPAMEKQAYLQSRGNRLAIPEDFQQLRSLTGPQGTEVKTLEYLPWDVFVEKTNQGSAEPVQYFSRQAGIWYLYPEVPDGTEFLCSFYGTIPELSQDAPNNWLLQISPQLYLFGALHFLYEYTMDNERASYWEDKFMKEVFRVQAMADSAEHKGSPLTVRLRG